MKKIKYSKNAVSFGREVEAKQSILKNKRFWGVIIILIMLGSVLAFGFFNVDNSDVSSKKVEYNGYKFINKGQGWITTYNGQEVAFAFKPDEIVDIKIENFGFGFNNGYIAFKPGEFSENSYEVNRLKGLLSLKGINVFAACVEEEGCGNLPITGCAENVIYLKLGNESSGYWDTCYILETKPDDAFRIIDRFIYNVYGIMA